MKYMVSDFMVNSAHLNCLSVNINNLIVIKTTFHRIIK